jgi:hypothetical protein
VMARACASALGASCGIDKHGVSWYCAIADGCEVLGVL